MGDTFADLLKNAKDALASVIDAMQEDSLDIPEGYDGEAPGKPAYDKAQYEDPPVIIVSVEDGDKAIRVNVTMPEKLVSRLEHYAERVQSNRSAVLAQGARMVLAAAADSQA